LFCALFLAQLLIPYCSVAQITGSEQDCLNAIPVCKAVYFQEKSYKGFGSISEINTAHSCVWGERNSVWYIFTISRPGDLEFSITPNKSSDDYDFALFNLTGHACDEIFNNDSLEVRCNYSAYLDSTSQTSDTGLKAGYDNNFEPSAGPSFCSPLSVTTGETYVLMIDNFRTSGSGYTLNLSLGSADINDIPPPEISFVGISADSASLIVRFSHPIFCNSINPKGNNFSISGHVPTIISSVSAGECLSGLYAQQFKLSLLSPIKVAGLYTLLFVPQSNQFTVMDFCGNIPLPDTQSFTIKNKWEFHGYEVR